MQSNKKNLAALYSIALAMILVNSYAFAHYSAIYYRYAFGEPEVTHNVQVWIKRAGSDEWIAWDVTHNLLTNGGKNFVKTQLGTAANSSLVDDISLSTSSSSPDVSWTNIPTEITSGGLERASGTYTSLGTGNWKIEYEFTASATHTNVQLSGISWCVTGNGGGLFACATITSVTLQSGDKLKLTWTFTVS